MNRLSGKLVLITGATKGIGRSTAFAYAEKGSNLILTGRTEAMLLLLKNEIEKEYKVKVTILKMDIRNSKEVYEMINSLPEDLKKIDILVNNAGLALGMEKVYTSSFEDFDTVVDTNVKGMLYMIRTVVPLMLEYNIDGHIVNVGSIAGDSAYAGGAVYCATKAAVKTLTDGLRIDLVDTPIKVTNIKPGLVETEFSKVRFKGDEDRANNTYKGIEALTPDDVAEVIIYATNLPSNIQLGEISLTPKYQADGRTVHRS
ncbi:MAG: SDR family NAD(P)-dependent oxidoreductase [Cetobacterium sp.]|uniref:SDR family NAD(P)-dependent oxidoreductase n=1 Tax=unclassified Cetobacterium TaxID=2630983 RepID=UPI00163BA8CF|nr:SDR family NAD(P)-dependent oxidoreductase [Cetobacterium sp. 2A]MBC2856649.1 SDR family NAD(P)-dependent oxidoreductase [Cetobacterium sp. 2A]